MTEFIQQLKTLARLLHRNAKCGQKEALARIEKHPSFKLKKIPMLPENIQRRHCLDIQAREIGFDNWLHAKCLLEGRDHESFGTFLHPGRCHGFTNIWLATYDEARAINETKKGHLIGYKKQFMIVGDHYMEVVGIPANATDYQKMGRDWIKPKDHKIRQQLIERVIKKTLSPTQTGGGTSNAIWA